jgi:hypothetical protein
VATAADRLGAPNYELDPLAPAEAARWRTRLQQTARPCGCKSGAALSLAALVAWPIWTFVFAHPRTLLEVGGALIVYVLVVVGSGLVGKVAGIAVGQWQHRRLRTQLEHRLTLVRQAVEE